MGAVAYFSGHRIVDLLGLGTNGLAEASNNGIGALYEALRHLPPAQRPDYFATYDTGPGPGMAPLRDAGVLEQPPEATFEVKTPPDLRDILAVPFREFTVSHADWSRAENADTVPAAGELRDYLDVADLATEREHDYTYLPAQEGMQPWTIVNHDADVVDGGRAIVGGEAFTVHNVLTGSPAVLIARTATHGTVPEMQVLVNGRPAGTWKREARPGAWQNHTFTIPAELVTSSTLGIEIRPPRPTLSPYPDYVSYAYWLTQ